MEQRKEIVRRYVSKGLRVASAVSTAGMSKSSYYYRVKGNKKGKPPTQYTRGPEGQEVSNKLVIKEIKSMLTPEHHDYGYHIISELLRRKGYQINPKKVYRLMRDHQLLHPPRPREKMLQKTFVRYHVPPLEHPFATVEVDIKYIRIEGERRNAYLVTFLCTFSRFAAVWDLQYRMTHKMLIRLLREFLSHPEVKNRKDGMKIVIRTDNGPQFIAKKLAEELESLEIEHEFTHPGTPQQNGHIEGFHSTVTRLICKRNVFENLDQAREVFKEFFFQYNYTRVMKSLLYYPPAIFIKLWDKGMIGIKKDNKNKEIFIFREKPTPELEASLSSEVLKGLNKNNIFVQPVLNTFEFSPVL